MKSYAPTTPSKRHMTTVDYSVLSKNRPHKALLVKLKQHAGRNSAGRITMRHQGGGNKRRYRIIDFKQNRLGTTALVETLEYDPYRTAFIALVTYKDNGKKAYILAPHGLAVGAEIAIAERAPLAVGNRMALKNIPVGSEVHNVEFQPGQGGFMVRSAGSFAEVLANADGYTDLKMPSGEVRRVLWSCLASLGQVSNIEHNLTVIGKAGRSRHLGVRPTVRGMVMNPVDHPYGGGEGRQPRGTRRPKDIWGNITGGRKTRGRKNRSNRLIVSRRKK